MFFLAWPQRLTGTWQFYNISGHWQQLRNMPDGKLTCNSGRKAGKWSTEPKGKPQSGRSSFLSGSCQLKLFQDVAQMHNFGPCTARLFQVDSRYRIPHSSNLPNRPPRLPYRNNCRTGPLFVKQNSHSLVSFDCHLWHAICASVEPPVWASFCMWVAVFKAFVVVFVAMASIR